MIAINKINKIISNSVFLKDFFIVLLLFFSTSLYIYQLHELHHENLITANENVYFQSDIKRAFSTMSDRHFIDNNHSKLHPFLPIQLHSPVYILNKFGISTNISVKIVVCIIASLWSLCIYIMFRLIGNTRLHATLLTLFGLSSASSMFWLSVPEIYSLGSLNLIIALSLAAMANQKKLPNSSYILMNMITLSSTITNWMSGILATLATKNIKDAMRICFASLSLLTILWLIQKRFLPQTVFFNHISENVIFTFTPNLDRLIYLFNSFFFHTLISPAVNIVGYNNEGWPLLSLQNFLANYANINESDGWPLLSLHPTPSKSISFAELACSLIWIYTLVICVIAFFRLKNHFPLKITIGFTILGQLFLHLFYGEEIFKYSLHFLPLLLALVSLSLITKYSKTILILISLLTPILFINNFKTFINVTKIAIPPYEKVKNQFVSNPNDPWPRGKGRIILANPGSKEDNKAFYEPGGSFSPAGQKYGVSIIIENTSGKLVRTSDTLPLNQISQSLRWKSGTQLPSVNAITEYYDATWSKKDLNDWQLKLLPNQIHNLITSLQVRSVGPYGGPIKDLAWDGNRLTINNQWVVNFEPLPKKVILRDELSTKISSSNTSKQSIHSDRGWATAKIVLSQNNTTTATFRKINPDIFNNNPLIKQTPLVADIDVNLPDNRFIESLNAQVAHMSMGLVDNETRPGDVQYYPLDWQRDGTYILVALLRTGQLETAELLSKKFAEHDFYGGFGAEADAPGLSIWALNSVAKQIKKQSYDEWLWPHIKRKVSYIEKMLYAKVNIEAPFTGKAFMQYANKPEINLIAEPSKNGLIIGKMDHHRPVLFVNAVSYIGLMEAADLAERLKYHDEAKHWRLEASNIKKAWREGLKVEDYDNDRTYISAIWPTWIGNQDLALIKKNLETRWDERRDKNNLYKSYPLWTYFEIGEAHQWLLLGDAERTWSTLNWFWNNQSSPGLYTWWEGDGVDISYVDKRINFSAVNKPSAITPHYWTAAEMALLQLDMLAYVDKSDKEPVLVIGQGVTKDWLNSEMSVKNLRLEDLVVDWYWQNNKMHVTVKGKDFIKVKLGNAFVKTTPVSVSFQQ